MKDCPFNGFCMENTCDRACPRFAEMEADGKLESFYNTSYSGHEGFYEDLLDEVDDSWEEEDIEFLRDLAENRGDSEAVERLNAMIGYIYCEVQTL